MKTLVTGGIRSGKSSYAERLVRDEPRVTYVATGPQRDDADWAQRVAAHQSRRPAHWTTVETTDPAAVLRESSEAVLVDCLGTWLTATLDGLTAWDHPRERWQADLDARTRDLVDAWAASGSPAVAVTNEVGFALVSEHRAGRLFADELGRLNQAMAAASDRVVLVVAGLPLTLSGP